jgi:UDPglucose 6-dehydrogenase
MSFVGGTEYKINEIVQECIRSRAMFFSGGGATFTGGEATVQLEELIKVNVSGKRLSFTSDIKTAVAKSLVCFIAVGTPQGEDGSADLKYVKEVAKSIGKSIEKYTVVIDKSTVPVGTADMVTSIIKEQTDVEFDVVSNPEFLKQGAAVDDFLNPDRVVIGSNSQRATEIMQELYAPFSSTGNPVIIMDVKSAEMTKYAANSFLAVKISYANEIANICEKVGADAEMVRIGMCTDKRIGSQFLFPGLGYGGSCFPKDVKALRKTAIDNGCDCSMLKAADDINKKQRQIFINKILKRFGNDLSNITFGIWGLAFKPQTNDMREAPSITIILPGSTTGSITISGCTTSIIPEFASIFSILYTSLKTLHLPIIILSFKIIIFKKLML